MRGRGAEADAAASSASLISHPMHRWASYDPAGFYVDDEENTVRMDSWWKKYAPCVAVPPLCDGDVGDGNGGGAATAAVDAAALLEQQRPDAGYGELEIVRSESSYIIVGICLVDLQRFDPTEERRIRNLPFACAYSCFDGMCARAEDETPERPFGGGASFVGDHVGLRLEFDGENRGTCTVYKNGMVVGTLGEALPRRDATNDDARWHFYVEMGSPGDTVRVVRGAVAPGSEAPKWVAPPPGPDASAPGSDALAANALLVLTCVPKPLGVTRARAAKLVLRNDPGSTGMWAASLRPRT